MVRRVVEGVWEKSRIEFIVHVCVCSSGGSGWLIGRRKFAALTVCSDRVLTKGSTTVDGPLPQSTTANPTAWSWVSFMAGVQGDLAVTNLASGRSRHKWFCGFPSAQPTSLESLSLRGTTLLSGPAIPSSTSTILTLRRLGSGPHWWILVG